MNFSVVCATAIVLALTSGCQTDSATTSTQSPKKGEAMAKMSADAFASVRLRIQPIPALGIEIAIPEDWVFAHHIEQDQTIWTVKSPCPDSVKFCTNYVLNAVPRQQEVALENYGNFLITSLQDKYDTFTLVNRTEEKINGIPSTTIDYIHLEQGLDLGGTTTFYFLDDTVVVVNFGALNEPKGDYVRYRGLYTRILSTIKPLKK